MGDIVEDVAVPEPTGGDERSDLDRRDGDVGTRGHPSRYVRSGADADTAVLEFDRFNRPYDWRSGDATDQGSSSLASAFRRCSRTVDFETSRSVASSAAVVPRGHA